jgi:hypothetical protein
VFGATEVTRKHTAVVLASCSRVGHGHVSIRHGAIFPQRSSKSLLTYLLLRLQDILVELPVLASGRLA